MNILLPLDGSDASNHTLTWVMKFLDQKHTTLNLIHVANNAQNTEFSLPKDTESQAILTRAVHQVKQTGFALGAVETLDGEEIAQSICNYAEERNMDQIIIGTHGRGLSRLLMGSVSQNVLKHTTRPALLIKPTQEIDKRSFYAGETKRGQKAADEYTFLLPISESTASPPTLDWVIQNLNPQRIIIHLLHAVPMIGAAGVIPQHLTQGEQLVARTGRKLHKAGYPIVKTQVKIGDPANEICNYADENEIDQIIIGTFRKAGFFLNLFGDTSEKVLTQAKQSVAVFYPNQPSKRPTGQKGQQQNTLPGGALW